MYRDISTQHASIAPLVVGLGVSAFAGGVAVAGWAPLALWPLPVVAYATLFFLLRARPGPTASLLLGLAFGLGLHGVGASWMYATLHDRVGLGGAMAAAGMTIFIAYLALFAAVPCLLWALWADRADIGRERADAWLSAAVFAALLTLGEWLRSVLFNGFTSLSLGYVGVDGALAGLAPVGGVYFTGLLLYACAALIGAAAGRSLPLRAALAATAAVFALGLALARVDWAEPSGRPMSFRLIQSHVSTQDKFQPRFAETYARRLAGKVASGAADLVATPETAFPTFLADMPPDVLPGLQHYAQQTASHLFLGLATSAATADGFNSVLQIAPDNPSGVFARYDKRRLMPFGEYSPLGFGWFTAQLAIPLKDLSAGRWDQEPFRLVKDGLLVSIGTLICQEDLIGRDAARWAASSTLLLNPSNLAWFDDGLAIEQRLQIARMRAVETARPILRVTNTGVTAYIDAHGRVVGRLAAGEEGVLSGSAQPMRGLTPYAQWPDALPLALCAVTVAAALALAWRRRRRS